MPICDIRNDKNTPIIRNDKSTPINFGPSTIAHNTLHKVSCEYSDTLLVTRTKLTHIKYSIFGLFKILSCNSLFDRK